MILIEFQITMTMAQPLYRQDKQPEAVNSAENAIEHDAVDILTGYPSWSTDTNDISDNNDIICDRNRRVTR